MRLPSHAQYLHLVTLLILLTLLWNTKEANAKDLGLCLCPITSHQKIKSPHEVVRKHARIMLHAWLHGSLFVPRRATRVGMHP